MTSEVRDFKDFSKFPGKIIDNIYTFPKLYTIVKSGKTRYWQVKIKLIVIEGELEFEHDWDDDLVQEYEIDKEFFIGSNKLPKDCAALVYNEQGYINGKNSRHPPTIIYSGSKGLEGHSNERNTFTQALIYARNQYLEKINAGYSIDINVVKSNSSKYYAMAAHKYDENIDRVVYPCYSQPKLDGVRCMMRRYDNKIEKYSRDLKTYNWTECDETFNIIFDVYPDIVLDGELYAVGRKLQEIVGVAKNKIKKFSLSYYIFDVFDTSNCKMLWSDRMKLIDDIFHLINDEFIVKTETTIVDSKRKLDSLYNKYIRAGYEGQMIRLDDIYLCNKYRELRSYSLLKRKKKYDAEFPLVGVLAGTNGRAKGAFIGIFQAKKKTFKASPKDMTMQEMKDLYITVSESFDTYKGQMATIEYEETSIEGVPLRPKFVRFRDHV